MRYRRIRYRYTEVVGRSRTRLLGERESLRPHATIARTEWKPPADVYETADTYVVTIELAGVNENDVEITLHPDALIVEGVRSCEACGDARYHAAQIWYGPFRLEASFPTPIDPERVGGRFERGFLSLTVPKVNESRP
ncbi:MAG: Hsp20/alpha crystallin family protein [Nitrospirota bacterium]